jgi:hypothetical protein
MTAMFGHRFSGVAAARRALSGLGLAAALLLSTLGVPAPSDAAEPPPPGPHARLQLVIKSVTVHDDREGFLSGIGEMELYAGIWRCSPNVPPPCTYSGYANTSRNLPDSVLNKAHMFVRAGHLFDAGTGDTVTIDREVPGAGDLIVDADTAPELGFAVHPGRPYVLQIDMDEADPSQGEYLGRVIHVIDMSERGLGVGTHTARSVRDDGTTPGDYTVTYEIRRAPLPDLKPVSIKVTDLPGTGEKRVCMAVQNVEVVHAGPFEVALKLNNEPVPGGQYTVGLLASGTHFDACVHVDLPTTGRYKLSAAVDEARRVSEFNEENNLYEVLYQPSGASGAPSPNTPPSTALPDLVVTAIKVDGRVPDGKDDCKDGRNDVTVVVKNQGTAKAGDFLVRLVADDDQGAALQEELGDGLDAGKEATVRFEDVRLKKGPHSLEATVDPTSGIAESNEANNARQVAATCKEK